MFGDRGFLSNWPDDVVCLVNGHPVTKNDILNWKRERQARQLKRKLTIHEPEVKPCFVWVFHVDAFIYHGWHLYVRTHKNEWGIERIKMILKIMAIYPCGLLPILENFDSWKPKFAELYHYPTKKRPRQQGLATARAVVKNHKLLDVLEV